MCLFRKRYFCLPTTSHVLTIQKNDNKKEKEKKMRQNSTIDSIQEKK